MGDSENQHPEEKTKFFFLIASLTDKNKLLQVKY